jgi:hypothetical protein
LHPDSRERYVEIIQAPSTEPPADAATLAERFLYRLFFELMVPVATVAEDPTGFRATRAREEPILTERLRAFLSASHAGK